MSLMTNHLAQTANFPTLHVFEREISYLEDIEKVETIVTLLKKSGLYEAHLVYCGIDGEALRGSGSFGERRETWGKTEEELYEAAKSNDGINNPLQYALDNEVPALAIFRGAMLTNDPEAFDGLSYGSEWSLIGAETLDAATVAVVYFN